MNEAKHNSRFVFHEEVVTRLKTYNKKISLAQYGPFKKYITVHATQQKCNSYTKLQLPWRQLVLSGQFISSTLFTNSYKPFLNSVPKLIISLKIQTFWKNTDIKRNKIMQALLSVWE